MAGEEVASGYLSIGPALVKDFRQKLDAQLKPIGAQAGRDFGTALGSGMPAGITAAKPAAITAARTTATEAGQAFSTNLRTTLDRGAVAAGTGFMGKLRATIRREAGTVLSGVTAVVGEVASSVPQLRQVQQSARDVADATSTAGSKAAALPGILAVAAGGFTIWQQAADNAKAAGDLYAETLDKLSGKATAATFQKAASDLLREFSAADWQQVGIKLEDAVAAVVQGGPALEDVMRRLTAARDAEVKAAGANIVAANQITEKYQRLGNAIRNTSNDVSTGRDAWAASEKAMQAAGVAAEQVGVDVDGAGTKVKSLNKHLELTVPLMNSIPGGISVTVTDNLAEVIGRARTAVIALQQVASTAYGAQYSAGAALNDYLAGIGSGAYEDPIAAAQKKAEDAARDAAKKAKDAAAAARRQAAEAARKARAEAAAAAKAARDQARREAEQQRLAAEREAKRDALRSTISSTLTTARSLVQPELTGLPRSAPGIKRALAKQLDSVRRFRRNIAILAKRGIPRIFLEQLLAAGLDGADQAQALVNAKDADFNEIRRLTKELNTEAGKFGKQSLDLLYGTGVNAAKALISGLDSQQAAIEKQMIKIAKGMEKAIKKALGIASPSKVGLSIGRNYGLSIAGGIGGTQRAVDRASATLVRPPRPVAVDRSNVVSIAGMRPLIEGGLHMHNPVERTLNGSATDALRTTAYLLGTGS